MPLPPKLQSLLDKLTDTTEDIVKDANKDVKSLENRLFVSLTEFVLGLDKDKSGNLKPTKANIKKLSALDRFLTNSIVDDKYLDDVQGFIKALEGTNAITAKYFDALDVGYVDDKAFNDIVNETLLAPIESTLTQEGLSQAVNTKLKQAITQSVVSGYSSNQLLDELELLVKGGDGKLGLLSRHVQQVTTDAANQFTATYFEVISADLGLEWYLYEGSSKDTSREFCIHRFGKFYHKSEVKSWYKLNWSGKIPTTNSSNIFIYRGGFNCSHQIIPVSTILVPKLDLSRISGKD